MSENVSPNRSTRRQIQTTLVVGNNGLTLDKTDKSSTANKKQKSKHKMSAKRLKRDGSRDGTTPVDTPDCQLIDLTDQAIPDPRPLETDGDYCHLLSDDEEGGDKNSSDSSVRVLDEIASEPEQEELCKMPELDPDYEAELRSDCQTNEPTLEVKYTMAQMTEQCLLMGLTLNTETGLDPEDSDSDQEMVTTSGAVDYEVEAIYDDKKENGFTLFWVKWKNYGEDDNTWEPYCNLGNCRRLLDEYKHIKHDKDKDDNSMKIYHNYYHLKGIIEDIVEKKVALGVTTTCLLIFNNTSLREFQYTKAVIKKWRTNLRNSCLTEIDRVSAVKNVERRVQRLTELYSKILNDLNILKRFNSVEEFFAFFEDRKQLERRLNRWEDHINDIIVTQNEGQTVKVENFVDCEAPPNDFVYISQCKTDDPSIQINDEPLVYCQCTDCESQQTDCCVKDNTASIVYTKNGILRDSRNFGHAIYECNKYCRCGDNCINRVFQKGRKHKLAIFKTDNGRGWGVRALEPIPKGSYVMEYVGEIITVQEANVRGAKYDAEGRTYLFDLDFTPDDDTEEEQEGELYKYTLDATKKGNVSHFVNHSCDPNLDTKVVWVNNPDPFMPHIALFAIKNIRLNEELSFDYKIIGVHGQQETEKSFDSGIGSESGRAARVVCRCGAYNCRQFLH